MENITQTNLSEMDLEYLKGYDFCTNTIIRNFFLNLSMYKDKIEDILPNANIDIDKFLDGKSIEEYEPDDLHFLDKNTYVCKVLYECLIDYMEKYRETLIKSFEKAGKEIEKMG